MPARKPKTLITRAETKADQAAREAAESAMTPSTDLAARVPPELYGDDHKIAQRTWRRMLELYGETDGQLVTAFDRDSLIEYCKLVEEIEEMEDMRRIMYADWKAQRDKAAGFKIGDPEEGGDGTVAEYLKQWEIANALYQKFQGLDARLDGKRKHLHTKQMSLYLTPRSRAGVAPPTKEPPEPEDEMARLLKKGNSDE